MRISHAEPKDIPAMVELLGDLFSIEPDFMVDPARQEVGLKGLLEDPLRALVLVARAPGAEQAVGMVTLQVLVSTAEGGQVGLVEDLVIHPEWRGQGLGAALLAELQYQGPTPGAHPIAAPGRPGEYPGPGVLWTPGLGSHPNDMFAVEGGS